jgi:alpha-L-fucosidase
MSERPTPTWYDDAKLGIFVHWGLYSVPGWAVTTGTLADAPQRLGWRVWFRDNPYAEWYANSLKIPGSPTADYHRRTYGTTGYADFVPMFDEAIRSWDPAEWADLFREAGARYVVLTTKHHDGFRLWPSRVPHPTLDDFHPSRDLVGELAGAVRDVGLRFGTYYSGGLDWSVSPRPIEDREDLGKTVIQDPTYVAYADAHWRELIERYDTQILWNDIAYPRRSELRAIVDAFYRRTPEGLVNDRFKDIAPDGTSTHLVPPDLLTPEYTSFATIRADKWEANRGIGYSFGYNRAEDEATFIPVDTLVRFFVDVVSKNGNMLLNVGPRADGSIQDGQLDRVRALGRWLAVNGEAIYGTRPWVVAEGTTDTGLPVRFTRTERALYAILLDRPGAGPHVLPGLRGQPGITASLLGHEQGLPAEPRGDGLVVTLPEAPPDSPAYAIRLEPPPDWAG